MKPEERRRIPVLIDTDIGDDVDDTAALIWLMNSPEFEIVGITTVFGNTCERADMVSELLHMKGLDDVPIAAGARQALIEPTRIDSPLQYGIMKEHNENITAGGTISDAVEMILRKVREVEGLVILELGMMTNLSMAFLIDPDTMKNARIVGMGGEFKDSLPEWNIKLDPEAARIVTDRARHLVLFGLDVTRMCGIEEKEKKKLCKSDLSKHFFEGVKVFRDKTGYPITLHDVLPAVWLLDPKVAKMDHCDYTVELSGNISRGAIIKKKDAYRNTRVAEKDFLYAETIDTGRFFRIFKERFT